MSEAQHTTRADAAPTYKIKRVRDREGQLFQIVNQSLNGPCPLLAIVNVLLLRGNICLPRSSPEVSEVCVPGGILSCIMLTMHVYRTPPFLWSIQTFM